MGRGVQGVAGLAAGRGGQWSVAAGQADNPLGRPAEDGAEAFWKIQSADRPVPRIDCRYRRVAIKMYDRDCMEMLSLWVHTLDRGQNGNFG